MMDMLEIIAQEFEDLSNNYLDIVKQSNTPVDYQQLVDYYGIRALAVREAIEIKKKYRKLEVWLDAQNR